jgi:hypothetical protein
MPFPALPAAIISGLLVSTPVAGGVEGAYAALIYDFEVAMICGLVNGDIAEAYRQTRGDLEQSSALSTEELRRIRIRAMAAAEREYDNRGLGGHRPWCQGEGRDGVGRILR